MYMPVHLYSEKNAVVKHYEKIIRYGTNALIVTGKSSAKKSGALDDVIGIFENNNIRYTIFDNVEENPSVKTVLTASRVGKTEGVDLVIGIGGGSPLDAAKAIAFLLAHPDGSAELLYTKGDDDSLPLILIPTTCGTGSEVTAVSVLTIPERHTKKSISHRIFADLALIDCKYLRTASVEILRNTALDALTHMIESYINSGSDDFSRMFVDAGLKLWKKNMYVLEDGKATDEQLLEMMNTAAIGGMAIAQDGTGIPHGLSYSLTYKLHVPHGKAVGYFTAGYLNAASEIDRNYILNSLGFADINDFQKWYIRLFGKTEVDVRILNESVEELWNNKPKINTAPFEITKTTLEEIAFYTMKY